MIIRRIEASDNLIVGKIIRGVLTEFGANREGFAWEDPELDHMTEAYSGQGQDYFVIVVDGEVVGGGGFSSFSCSLNSCCELQKMYMLPSYRGFGLGEQLIKQAIRFASDHYHWCYLETLHTMHLAEKLYRQIGFVRIPAPIIQTEHNGCDRWFIKELMDG